jgi:uncharacterized protein YigE (DUF2233 family)
VLKLLRLIQRGLSPLLLCFICVPTVYANDWRSVGQGLAYLKFDTQDFRSVHLLKVDLKLNSLRLLFPKNETQVRATLKEHVSDTKAIAAINASFFDQEGHAMGLLIDHGKERNSLRNTGWGIFQLIDGIPSIIHTRDYRASSKRSFAVQSGPRLLVKNVISKFKGNDQARRSAICVTADKKIILAVVNPSTVSLEQFAKVLQDHCTDALNFDGGSSTQFYLKTDKASLYLPGREPIPNSLAVFPTDSSTR